MPIFQEDSGSPHSPLQPDTIYPTSQAQRTKKDASYDALKCEQIKYLSHHKSCSPEPGEGLNITQSASQDASDRGELVEWIGHDRSPRWTTNLLGNYVKDQTQYTPSKSDSLQYLPLLPSPTFREPDTESEIDKKRNNDGLQIERPRSALHSGDFTEARNSDTDRENHDLLVQRRFEYSPWQSTSPPRQFTLFNSEVSSSHTPSTPVPIERRRAPSVSSSLSSSFVLKPPTSPLVQSHSNEDFEISTQINPIDIDTSFSRNSRRHTLHSAQSSYSSFATSFIGNRPLPHLRRDNTFPYQAHQPRRSLTSISLSQPSSTPQTPLTRSRRPSFSEGSPLHASMVGSYEESILRGRMSTTPSKPLDFVAQIGVLGLGKCKSSLRCPPHVTIPFPAVFYSYETTTHGRATKSSDEPSPYVGQIDLENNLPHQQARREKRRKHAAASTAAKNPANLENADCRIVDDVDRLVKRDLPQRRRSISPRTPAGGSYRIPEKGQLQIIIKNPNKTAVKLFLIPYDLEGMEPGTKTFIRQRSYSVGPIIDGPVTVPRRSSTSLDRPVLRYLVHLHICSPSRGRFYLYKSIRIVFANRVPDGKEKLRNEISLPDPRFTIYKPGREHGAGNTGNIGASVVAEIAQRRRSSGYPLNPVPHLHDDYDGFNRVPDKMMASSHQIGPFASGISPIQPIPFNFARKPVNIGESTDTEPLMTLTSPTSSKSSRFTSSSHSENVMPWNVDDTVHDTVHESYNKLKKGEVGYGGNMFAESIVGRLNGEGLLAKKLKDLGVQPQ